MALPKIEIVEDSTGHMKGNVTRIPLIRSTTCSSCDQVVKRMKEGDNESRILPHNRKVFRRMKQDGSPDWIWESCPGGAI